MRIMRNGLPAALLVAVLAVAGGAWAGNFTPTIKFKLATTKSNKPTAIKIDVRQERGEEELATVELRVPGAFKLPNLAKFEGCTPRPDVRIPCDGEVLGEGLIHIMVGPGCAQAPQDASRATQVELPAKLVVVEETQDQRQAGTLAIWNLEITGVTTIPLSVGKSGGMWVMKGDIPANPATCPEFDFTLDIFKTSEASVTGVGGGRTIFVNPKVKKNTSYKFSAKFWSLDSPATRTVSQKVTIKR